jgi:predicted HicB family RNase H-like nuclease
MSAITIRVPESIYGHLKKVALDDGVSINQFFVTAAAEKLAALDT